MARGAPLSLSTINSANPNGICQGQLQKQRKHAHARPYRTDGLRHRSSIRHRIRDRHGAVARRVEVMLCDIEEEALATAVEKLKLTNADVDGVRADVSLKAEIKTAADATVSRYGRVHILVNNAG